jgi:hypothetical protein
VRRRDDRAGRGGRADDLAVPGEGSLDLDAHFQVDPIIPVESDVPARARDLPRADDAPHQAAGLRDDPGEFPRSRPSSHDGQGTTAELFEPDIISHANHPGWPTLDPMA